MNKVLMYLILANTNHHSDGHVMLQRTPKCTGKGQRYFIKRYAQV